MATPARGYLDALHALSGDPIFAPARQNLLKGLSDATLSDIIGDCLKINTSRVVREHIIKILLDAMTAQRHSQPSGRGYLSALYTLSGDPDLAAARHDLIEHLSDETLDYTITECFGGDVARASQEQVIELLLDIIAQQTQSRAQEDADRVKEEVEEELPQHDADIMQASLVVTRDVKEEEDPTVLSGGDAAGQEDVPNTNQTSNPARHTVNKRRFVDDPNHPGKRIKATKLSTAPSKHATFEHESSAVKMEEEEEEPEEGEIVESIEQRSPFTTQAPLHPKSIKVKLCVPDSFRAFGNLSRLPLHIKMHLLSALLTDYGFEEGETATWISVLQYGHASFSKDWCINTLLHGQGPCTWMHGGKKTTCDYCVATRRVCARLATSSQQEGTILALHALPWQRRIGIKMKDLDFWILPASEPEHT